MRAASLALPLLAAALALAVLPTEAAPPTAESTALARAQEAATRLEKALKDRMGAALMGGGAVAAMGVYTAEALYITGVVSHETGVKLGRSSLRIRNAANVPPDWVAIWLAQQGERRAEGVPTYARVEDTAEGRVARVIRPLAIEQQCMSCHGPAKQLHPGVQAILAQQYPTDVAKGYKPGDLRGALWAEVAIDAPPGSPLP